MKRQTSMALMIALWVSLVSSLVPAAGQPVRSQPTEQSVRSPSKILTVSVARLQAMIGIDPDSNIEPGRALRLAATVTNIGAAASAPGQIQVVFVSPGGINGDIVRFQTELQPLPSVQPGQSMEIRFTATHKMPSVLDFVREDWLFKGYEARVSVGNVQHKIGERAVSFVASYYSSKSTAKETPADVSVAGADKPPVPHMVPPRIEPRLPPNR